MRLAGQSAVEAEDNAPGFLLGFQIVGCVYVVGNAIGMLALRGYAWVFWVTILVNVTQGFGFVAIPPEFWDAARDHHGFAGLPPSIVTDGGAIILALALIGSFIVYRTPWAYQRPVAGAA